MMEDRSRKIGTTLCLLLLSIGCFISPLCASGDVIFHDSFDEKFDGRWIVSEKQEYSGVWKHEKSEGHDDYGLLVSQQARKYAIVKELDQPVELKDGTIVLQYEVRLQNGLECGGAYIKYLRPQEAGWIPKEFDNESPYTIMFGPDKCGATNKVHFILKHKNPKSGNFVEHHLKFPPSVPSDKLTHVYTAILKPDNELSILIDGEEKKKANFLSKAPGCGEWKRPMKRNPAYKGKWHAPLIDNPNYKGIWKPRDIDNPEYFELEKPDFEPIAAIGIEIWTMQDGILFDNIVIASSEKAAESLRVAAWKPKFEVEKEKQKEEDAVDSDGLKGVQKLVFDYLYKVADLPFLGEHKVKVLDLLEKAEKQPNLTIGVIVSIVVIFFSILLKLIFGGKKKPEAKVSTETKKTDVAESSNNQGSSEEKEEQNETAPRRRSVRRDN
ncbi:Calnexin homolog 1 [Striga hermonthica]|uniref:Calnexin homolog 1 n=1 Tax=Striga hermonthica TaxID=68872 RepID=A0A9N7MNG4_STRHE|nr:Calnexin homolog 1 [Striga hermonthica]